MENRQNKEIELPFNQKIIEGILFLIFSLIGIILFLQSLFTFDITDYNDISEILTYFYPLLFLPIICSLIPFSIDNGMVKKIILILTILGSFLFFNATSNILQKQTILTEKADVILIKQ